MDALPYRSDTDAMVTATRYELMDEAEDLAMQAFGPAAEAEHIEAVFERLELHWRWGLPADGAVTIH